MNKYQLLGYKHGRRIRQKIEDTVIYLVGTTSWLCYSLYWRLRIYKDNLYCKSISYYQTLPLAVESTSGTYTSWRSSENIIENITAIHEEVKKKVKINVINTTRKPGSRRDNKTTKRSKKTSRKKQSKK